MDNSEKVNKAEQVVQRVGDKRRRLALDAIQLAQVVIPCLFIITALVNLTIRPDTYRESWWGLIGTASGFLLPSPLTRKSEKNDTNNL